MTLHSRESTFIERLHKGHDPVGLGLFVPDLALTKQCTVIKIEKGLAFWAISVKTPLELLVSNRNHIPICERVQPISELLKLGLLMWKLELQPIQSHYTYDTLKRTCTFGV